MDTDPIPFAWRVRAWLAEHLPRSWAVALGIRRLSPGRRRPRYTVHVDPIDTGGGFRAAWRPQDPSVDPKEPNGGESSSAGTDHGWANCSMSSGAMGLAYQQPRGSLAPWGGDLRHRQSDLSGGTDLYDVRTAWAEYGDTLTIKTGSGWSGVTKAHGEGRAIIVQGEGDVPGNQTFDGGHACVIAPETHSSGDWLFGDPLASGWQWVSPSSIRSWMERMSSGCYFGVGELPPSDPDPDPPPPVPPPPPGYTEAEVRAIAEWTAELAVGITADRSVGAWVAWLRAPRPGPGDAWQVGTWADPVDALFWDADPCEPGAPAAWSRGPLLPPVADAATALASSATWDRAAWRAALWRV